MARTVMACRFACSAGGMKVFLDDHLANQVVLVLEALHPPVENFDVIVVISHTEYEKLRPWIELDIEKPAPITSC